VLLNGKRISVPRKIILFLLLMVSISALAMAEEKASQGSLVIKLIYPTPSGAAMKAPGQIQKPQEISGRVPIDIQPKPQKAEKDRYLVEYFLDDQLIYETTGFDGESPSTAGFGYILDTTKYENGRHKLVINFWDKEAQSAIGSREVVINNSAGE
jgi:hypothetical protein